MAVVAHVVDDADEAVVKDRVGAVEMRLHPSDTARRVGRGVLRAASISASWSGVSGIGASGGFESGLL
jgi:hypothetical protein